MERKQTLVGIGSTRYDRWFVLHILHNNNSIITTIDDFLRKRESERMQRPLILTTVKNPYDWQL